MISTENQNSILEDLNEFKSDLIKSLKWNINYHKEELKMYEVKLNNMDLVEFRTKKKEDKKMIIEELNNFKSEMIRNLDNSIDFHKEELNNYETKLKNVDLIDFKIKE